jgi:hypothetical protein
MILSCTIRNSGVLDNNHQPSAYITWQKCTYALKTHLFLCANNCAALSYLPEQSRKFNQRWYRPTANDRRYHQRKHVHQLALPQSRNYSPTIHNHHILASFLTHSKMGDASARTATVSRKTSETDIQVTLALDCNPGVTKQVIDVSTGIGFLDHVCSFGEKNEHKVDLKTCP